MSQSYFAPKSKEKINLILFMETKAPFEDQ